MGLDFWPVLDDEKGRKNMFGLQGRYPTSSWRQSDEIICCIVPPGPDGALSSSKLEILHEGLQETEARIAIEKAGKGGKVLDGRVNALRPYMRSRNTPSSTRPSRHKPVPPFGSYWVR